MSVFVVDRHGKPLMPCTKKRACLLLERGRARLLVRLLPDRRPSAQGLSPPTAHRPAPVPAATPATPPRAGQTLARQALRVLLVAAELIARGATVRAVRWRLQALVVIDPPPPGLFDRYQYRLPEAGQRAPLSCQAVWRGLTVLWTLPLATQTPRRP